MKQIWRNNSLSIVLFALFFIFLIGQSVSGHHYSNQELLTHGQPPESYMAYLGSGEFVEATFENWESEFLQMGALVIFTVWFRQKGALDSKKITGKEEVDTHSRYSIIHGHTVHTKLKAIGKALYANSLTIALFSLFIISFTLHALGGTAVHNQEAQMHHQEILSTWQFIRSSEFWFQSFQNWQSEFLSVGVLILFSIFLRQRYSSESKPIGSSNAQTGS